MWFVVDAAAVVVVVAVAFSCDFPLVCNPVRFFLIVTYCDRCLRRCLICI